MGDGPDDRIRITPEVIANLRTALTKDHVDDLAYEGRDHDSEACERCVGERLLIRHAADLLDAAGRCGHAVFMRAFVESQNDVLNGTVLHWQEQYARERDECQVRHEQDVELVNVAVARAERAEARLAEAERFSPDEATAIRRVNAGLRFVDRGEALCLPEVKKAWEGLYEAALTVVPREDRS